MNTLAACSGDRDRTRTGGQQGNHPTPHATTTLHDTGMALPPHKNTLMHTPTVHSNVLDLCTTRHDSTDTTHQQQASAPSTDTSCTRPHPTRCTAHTATHCTVDTGGCVCTHRVNPRRRRHTRTHGPLSLKYAPLASNRACTGTRTRPWGTSRTSRTGTCCTSLPLPTLVHRRHCPSPATTTGERGERA